MLKHENLVNTHTKLSTLELLRFDRSLTFGKDLNTRYIMYQIPNT